MSDEPRTPYALHIDALEAEIAALRQQVEDLQAERSDAEHTVDAQREIIDGLQRDREVIVERAEVAESLLAAVTEEGEECERERDALAQQVEDLQAERDAADEQAAEDHESAVRYKGWLVEKTRERDALAQQVEDLTAALRETGERLHLEGGHHRSFARCVTPACERARALSVVVPSPTEDA